MGPKTVTSRLDYLSIPILLKYAKRHPQLSAYILAGPRFDIFLGYANGRDDLVWGIEDDFKDVSFGLSIGFGLARTIFISREILIEFIHNFDLSWLYEYDSAHMSDFRIKNKSFNISVGIGL